jgi:glycosyltransferase involved in cell wall biosynthesis
VATDLDVLQVITSSARRGAERFALALQPELEGRGLSTRTVALVAGHPPTLDAEVLGARRLGLPTLRRLRAEAAGAGVVVAHGSSTLPASVMAAAGTGVPIVYRNIGDPRYWATSPARRLRSALLLSRTSAVVALSEAAAHHLSALYRVPADRVTAIPTGVPATEFPLRSDADRLAARAALGHAPEVRLAVYVGALSPEKAVTDAVVALAELPERWHLAIAGEGPTRPDIERAAATVGGDRVHLMGQVADPAQLMTAADLLLLPSLTEGLPGVVIEAAMVGVPSVVTDVGFVDEIVEQGVSGEIVPVGDPGELAAAVLRCEPRLAEMGAEARRRAEETYSLPVVAGRWYDLLAPLAAVAQGSTARA